MDQDLVAFLSQHFAVIDRRLEEFRQETLQRLDGVDQRLDGMDHRLDRMDQRLERVEDSVRGAHISIEDFRGTISLVAEGVTSVREELDRKIEELSQKVDETAAFNRQAYEDLDVRVRTLEAAKRVRSTKGGPRQK